MSTFNIVLLVFLVLNLGLTIWFILSNLRKKKEDTQPQLDNMLLSLKADILKGQLDGINSFRDSLEKANTIINDRLAEGASSIDQRMKVFGEIENKLGQLQNQTLRLEEIGSNIQSLSQLLKPPKLRGNIGETFLENMLSQVLPSALYETQYRFSSGQRVDAIIRIGGRVMPIDSKFPIESFQRSIAEGATESDQKLFLSLIRKHIDDIASKYIRTDENTTETALMYIPSEAVYTAFVSDNSPNGFEYALSKAVIPSSPGHLYAFLASLIEVYRQAGLTADSRQLAQIVNSIADSVDKLRGYHRRVESSIRGLSTSFEKAQKETDSVSSLVEKLREPELGVSESGPVDQSEITNSLDSKN